MDSFSKEQERNKRHSQRFFVRHKQRTPARRPPALCPARRPAARRPTALRIRPPPSQSLSPSPASATMRRGCGHGLLDRLRLRPWNFVYLLLVLRQRGRRVVRAAGSSPGSRSTDDENTAAVA
ncbi:hypothetical protein EVAR_41174_1 [Eumeta japonica]|uniref:Uncharacterized protein n=1 Tax=Eumeta variegata TaxID=151549 RepID=A0A4C1YA89_EUMVA|nr:hypothetical protein EVAR_41174_1 [Eumeta japonica]